MGWADVSRGVQGAVQQQLLRRMQEQQMALKAQESEQRVAREARSDDRLDRDFAFRTEQHDATQARLAASDELAASDRAFSRAGQLAEQIPADSFIAESDPSVDLMTRGGRGALLQPTPELAAMGEDFQGPMNTPGGELPQAAKLGREQGRIHMGTAAQRNTVADNERAAQTERDRVTDRTADNARADEAARATAAYRLASLNKPTGGGAADSKPNWVMRDGKPVDIGRSGTRPGDTPYNASAAEKAAAGPAQMAQARETTNSAIALIDELIGSEDKKTPEHHGLGAATGAYELRGFTQGAVDASAIRDQLVATLTLPNLGALKGPMSDKDILFVKQLATQLGNPKISIEAARKAANTARTFLRKKLSEGGTDEGAGSGEEFDFVNGQLVPRK